MAFLCLPIEETLNLTHFESKWEEQRILFIDELPIPVLSICFLLNPVIISLVKIAMDKILTLCFQQKLRFLLWVNPFIVSHGSQVSQCKLHSIAFVIVKWQAYRER